MDLITPNINKKMRAMLSRDMLKLLKLCGALAEESGLRAYVVGGFVRDLLLGVRNLDVDLVIEGDAIEFGRKMARRLRGKLVPYSRFGTATIYMHWPPGKRSRKFKIDLATARTESYERPAALPKVKFGTIREDISRRDFTINAMAVSLTRKDFGNLLDFFGGKEDLSKKKIRVLHDASFVDDPTRIFRAIRFAERYHFTIEKHTEDLIKHAVNLKSFEHTSKERIRNEIALLLSEDYPLNAVKKMARFHELRFIHPDIKLGAQMEKEFAAARRAIRWFRGSHQRDDQRHLDAWIIYFMILIRGLTYRQAKVLCDRFALSKWDRLRILSFIKDGSKLIKRLSSSKRLKPSEIYRVLNPISYETILAMMAVAKTKRVRNRLTNFIVKYSAVKVYVGGEDLRKMGLRPGPEYRKLLEKLLWAKLDLSLDTKRDEMVYLKRLIKK
ncbi:MAG: CCA tRNA nucleotidyltransferase [Candidatus Omnitrophica bacterium]|nr:CCA tRNA nucleotidyltransferase [Candidatus Omnitrophota bacterium]